METNIRKLCVGDKVCNIRNQRWSDGVVYSFATVIRLTATQAVLSDGTKLINEPTKISYTNGKYGFSVYGDRWTKWQLVTGEILVEASIEKERQFINKWFDAQKFTNEQKKSIYNLLNPKTENNAN